MTDGAGNWITYNGEIYNYLELRDELGERDSGRAPTPRSSCARYASLGRATASSTSAACSPSRSGTSRSSTLFCARDRFGIKPFYYTVVDDVLYFASEIKALLPFLPGIETDLEGSRTTSPSSSASAARRCSRASTSCCRATCSVSATGRSRRALLGGLLRARLRPHRAATSRSSIERAAARLGPAPPAGATSRSARTSAAAWTRASSRRSPRDARPGRAHRRSPVGSTPAPATTRATYARELAAEPASRSHEIDDRRGRTSSTTSSGSSTTSTTRSPGPGRSRSTWSPGCAREAAEGACSAARAATRSSAATRAT